jgi:hypothetical protein
MLVVDGANARIDGTTEQLLAPRITGVSEGSILVRTEMEQALNNITYGVKRNGGYSSLGESRVLEKKLLVPPKIRLHTNRL